MRRSNLRDAVVVAVGVTLASVFLVGCGSDAAQPPTGPGTEHEHVADAGHDHGDHVHLTEGPHGGHLIELGNEAYRAELLHGDSAHTVTIHLLDAAAEQAVPVSQNEITLQLFRDGQFVDYTLKAVEQEADATGSASQFEITDAELCETLCSEEEVRGRLHVTIDGTPLTGIIEHGAHCDHEHGDHDHGHEGHDHGDHDHESHDHGHGDHEHGDHDHGHEGHDHS
jgi:hypothetical protein